MHGEDVLKSPAKNFQNGAMLEIGIKAQLMTDMPPEQRRKKIQYFVGIVLPDVAMLHFVRAFQIMR